MLLFGKARVPISLGFWSCIFNALKTLIEHFVDGYSSLFLAEIRAADEESLKGFMQS